MNADPHAPIPTKLASDGEALVIGWSDGVQHRLSWRLLREACPCATCRAQATEPPPLLPVLKPAEAQPTRAVSVRPVGNYAYSIQFSDGHNTGIYSLDYLRWLGEQAEKRAQ